jgi:hypothetical protein
MDKTQVTILVVLGVLVIAVFSGLGVAVHNTLSSCPILTPVPTPARVPLGRPLPAVCLTGDQSETTCRVEAFLRDLGYDVVGVRDVTDDSGDRTLVTYVRDSDTQAQDTLVDVNSVISLYVATPRSPFGSASVVIWSSENEVIVTSVVLREDVEAWLDGGITTDQFVDRLLVQSH